MIEHDVNIYAFDDYVYFFEDLFLDIKRKNMNYTQRDFAKDLDLSPPRISQILKRKEGISVKRAKAIAENIELNKLEKEYLYHLVLSKHSKSKTQKEISTSYIKKFNHNQDHTYLSKEKYSLISMKDWDLIWTLLELESNLDRLRLICTIKGIDKSHFNDVILELLEHDLIGVIEGRVYRKKHNIAFGNSVSSKEIRNHHIYKLNESIHSLEVLNNKVRKNESMTFSIKKSDYKILEKRVEEFIDNFRVGISEINHDEVMTLNISLFPSFFNSGDLL